VILPGLLAACTAPAPAIPAPAASKPGSVLPTYIPLQGGPKPDYPSAGEQYEDGWDNYPSPAPRAWTREAPGSGGPITALSNAFNPPGTPFDQNPAWQAVNKALNANVMFNLVAPADYAAKMAPPWPATTCPT